MKIAITGSSGFIGNALVRALESRGDEVVRVVRAGGGPGKVLWDPELGALEPSTLEGIDAAVNLAGEPIGKRRWTARQKAKIVNGRVHGTGALARSMAALSHRPRVLVSASAMGFYGERGDEILTEDSSSGTGFLPSVCRRWEAATAPAREAGSRVVHLRTGLVLDPSGSLLKRVLIPFRFGLGGRLGDGQQWMSWIMLADHVRAIVHLLDEDAASGPFNIAAPNPVRNDEFTRVLGRVLRRPAVFPIPRRLIAIPYGRELANELLSSTRMLPGRLDAVGFRFQASELEPALRAMLAL
ncbi:MAG TPA: TIGR01777 family oxidoreductase [Actinomycetota bacterium]|nr:TIGR01777 family oxidoreductase [Actinomycetota bacterium]